ncbi:GNAT family N-acetyltransferase [Candidatus Paracaedibacter symbiosus]|uniref:GNAT family N-acetyltransferase n=1 Tax=Candidatus Paracaedibacter symbiosus TaxID=244582 RepID=UPI00050952B1|nr:GNAT family N-acetyltransferase [Candidatus Paracaedibacter symbiosus]
MPLQNPSFTIHFEKVISRAHQKTIFDWLAEPHLQEFWDNSQEHKDDILNFINGRKEPSNYFYGTIIYWMGIINDEPFCFILTDNLLTSQEDLSDLHRAHLSKTGKTICIDFGIGNKNYLSKGLAAPTLKAFTEFYKSQVDPSADTFIIDPEENNPRARHVYEKAGFNLVGDYAVTKGVFTGQKSFLMVKELGATRE